MRQSSLMVMTALLVTTLLLALAAGAGPPRAAGSAGSAAVAVSPELPAGSGVAAFLPPRPQEPVEQQRQAAAAYSGATLALAAMVVGLSALFALQAATLRRLGGALRMGRRSAWPQPEVRPAPRRVAAEVLQFRPRPRSEPAADADRPADGDRVERVLERLLRAVG